jgi:hypothetical protein
MVKLYYRGMMDENGKPKIGRSARLLRVRLGIDINVEQIPLGYLDQQGHLLPQPERESSTEVVAVAIKDTKGMSVSLLPRTKFRYALVGVEVDEFRTYSELMEDLANLQHFPV